MTYIQMDTASVRDKIRCKCNICSVLAVRKNIFVYM